MISTTTVDHSEPKPCVQVQRISLNPFLEFPYLFDNVQCNSAFKFFPGKEWYASSDLGCISLTISVAKYIFWWLLTTDVYSLVNDFNLCLLTAY